METPTRFNHRRQQNYMQPGSSDTFFESPTLGLFSWNNNPGFFDDDNEKPHPLFAGLDMDETDSELNSETFSPARNLDNNDLHTPPRRKRRTFASLVSHMDTPPLLDDGDDALFSNAWRSNEYTSHLLDYDAPIYPFGTNDPAVRKLYLRHHLGYVNSANPNIEFAQGLQNKFTTEKSRLVTPDNLLLRREIMGSVYGEHAKVHPRIAVHSLASTKDSTYYFPYDIGNSPAVRAFASSFCNHTCNGDILAVADEEGSIGLINVEKGAEWERTNGRDIWKAHSNAIFEICWSPDDSKLVTASGDQSLRVWDVETQTEYACLLSHQCSAKTVRYNPMDPNLLVSGSRDGSVMAWDLRCVSSTNEDDGPHKKPVHVIKNAHQLSYQNALLMKRKKRRLAKFDTVNDQWSVTGTQWLIHNNKMIASVGASDGILKYWDVRYHGSFKKENPKPVYESSIGTSSKRAHGFSTLEMDKSGSRLFACCTDHSIYQFSALNPGLSPMCTYSDEKFRCESFYVKCAISPDEKFLLSGSSSQGEAYIWEIDGLVKRTAVAKLPTFSTGEATAVSFHRNSQKLAVCADDSICQVFDFAPQSQRQCILDPNYRVEIACAQPADIDSLYIRDDLMLPGTMAVPNQSSKSKQVQLSMSPFLQQQKKSNKLSPAKIVSTSTVEHSLPATPPMSNGNKEFININRNLEEEDISDQISLESILSDLPNLIIPVFDLQSRKNSKSAQSSVVDPEENKENIDPNKLQQAMQANCRKRRREEDEEDNENNANILKTPAGKRVKKAGTRASSKISSPKVKTPKSGQRRLRGEKVQEKNSKKSKAQITYPSMDITRYLQVVNTH